MHVLAVQTGEGKNGTWKKQDFVIETDGQYPKKVCLTIWGDKFNETFLVILSAEMYSLYINLLGADLKEK